VALGVEHVPFANAVGVGDDPTVGAELFFRVDELNRTGRFVFDFGLLAFRLLAVGSVVG